jgi:hypothetical protein
MELPDIKKFRELNSGLYSAARKYQREYFMLHRSGTKKEVQRKRGPQGKAQSAAEYAEKIGQIAKPCTACQVCDKTDQLVKHHWHGYNYKLDVWWVCHSCNKKLKFHDGSMTLEQARQWIKKLK